MGLRNTPPRTLAMLAVVLVLLGSAACQPTMPAQESPLMPTDTSSPLAGTATPTMPTAKAERAQETATPPTPDYDVAPVGSEAEQAIAAAKADLAARFDVAAGDIIVKSVEEVQWRDTSLGCPRPGMMYAQVITPGYRVLLEATGQIYEYHTDRGRVAVLCEEEAMADVPTIPGTVEPGLGGLISLAKEDLAQVLSIPVEQIEVLEARAVVWPDAGLGCPQPGMKYRQVPMDGALIRLAVDGKVYEYHSGGGRDPFLCEQPLKLEKDTPPQIDLLKLTPPSPSD